MIETASPMRRYLALWFPLLTADRWHATNNSGPDDGPLAFVENQRGVVRVVALNPHALRFGLTAGLTLADARARLPELAAVEQDSYADRLWLDRIADGCERWTPMVALDPPDGVTLDITGCAHLSGGEAALVAKVERQICAAGLTLRCALADTPEAAQALARFQSTPATNEEAVYRLPIAALRLEAEAETALHRAGLKTLGDLAARPKAPLAARFGAEMVAALNRLLGHADSRISPRRALPALIFERRFAEPIARTEDVLMALNDLVCEAATVLEERCEGGRCFIGRLYRSDGVVREITIQTGLPTRNPAVTVRLFRDRIDTLADPIDPGFGFDLVRLAVPTVEALGASQLKLEGANVSEEAMAGLIDRLSARLGRDRVRRFIRRDTHIPEQQVQTLPAIEASDPTSWPILPFGEPSLRPLHLFDPPQLVEVLAEVPDGPPRRFRWRRAMHEVTHFEGPERLAGEWWRVPVERLPEPEPSVMRKPQDFGDAVVTVGQPAHLRPNRPLLTRDYFRVEDTRGRRFWLFRHGLYERETISPVWYIHGLFA